MDICQEPDALKAMMVFMRVLKLALVMVPLIIIVMTTLDIYKIINAKEEGSMVKKIMPALKRIFLALIVFFIPTFVTVILSIMGDRAPNYVACMENATPEKIAELIVSNAQKALDKAREDRKERSLSEAKQAIEKMPDGSEKDKLLKEYEELKKQIKENRVDENRPTGPVGGSSGGGTGGSDNGGGSNYGDGGTSGEYFSPLQGFKYSFGSRSTTGGCSGSGAVQHDASVSVGTPVYASADGTATFYQYYCSNGSSNQLYSYGNSIKIAASNGSTIIYAHLNKFAPNVSGSMFVTESCPKKGSSAPCSSSTCKGTMKTNIVKTMTVKKGDLIGYSGDTGNSIAPHLNVEIHEGSKCIADLDKAFGLK